MQAGESGFALAEQGERLEAMAQRASAATDTILTLQAELQKAQRDDAAHRDKVPAAISWLRSVCSCLYCHLKQMSCLQWELLQLFSTVSHSLCTSACSVAWSKPCAADCTTLSLRCKCVCT